MNKVCNIDTSQLDKILNNLSEENRQRAMMKALNEGAKVLKTNTQQNLIKKMGSAATSTTSHKKRMIDGIGITPQKTEQSVIISIMREFRLKFFEMGTKERYRKVKTVNSQGKVFVKRGEKGGYTGTIKGLHFFKEARENTSPIEEAIIRTMEEEINKLIK